MKPTRHGFGEAPRFAHQVVLLQRQQPETVAAHAITTEHGHTGTVAEGLHLGQLRPHRGQRLPAAIAPLQLQLFAAGHGHHRQQARPGVPEPLLAAQRQVAAVDPCQQQPQWSGDGLAGKQQQAQGVAFP